METSAQHDQKIDDRGNELAFTFEEFALPKLPPGRPFKDVNTITTVAKETSRARTEVELNVLKSMNGFQIVKKLSDHLMQIEEVSSSSLTPYEEIAAKIEK